MIHIRLDAETKAWAEQLAGAMGISLTEYIRRLIVADKNSLSDEERAFLDGFRKREPKQGVASRGLERKKGARAR
jgi:hypothetical protein